MKILNILVISFLLASTSGCSYKTISHGAEVSQEDATSIKLGKTDKSDIFLKFGEPTKTADDENVFFYTWTRGSKSSFFGLGSGKADANTLVIIFDEDDVVKNYRITRGAVDSGQID